MIHVGHTCVISSKSSSTGGDYTTRPPPQELTSAFTLLEEATVAVLISPSIPVVVPFLWPPSILLCAFFLIPQRGGPSSFHPTPSLSALARVASRTSAFTRVCRGLLEHSSRTPLVPGS